MAKEGEVWQMYNRSGEPDPDGQLTANANIWLYRRTERGIEVLFQKRSKYIDKNAGKFDVSAGGHIDEGETPLVAALRETREEIGAELSARELTFLCSFRSGEKLLHVYVVDWTGREDVFHFNDNEVELVKWVPLSEMNDFVAKYAKPPLQKSTIQLDMLKEWLNGDNPQR